MKMNNFALTLLVVIFMGASRQAAIAQGLTLSIASDNAGTLQYESANGEYFDLSKSDQITYIAWNDDGSKLAFIKHTHVPNDNDVREIGVVQFDDNDTPSQPMILQTHRPAFLYNLDWMQDGRILFVTEHPDTNPETGLHDKFDIMAIDSEGNDEVLGTFKPTGECGGGSPFPTDWRYTIEVGGGLGGYFMTLTETPYGILYTSNCSGSEQTILDPETAESRHFASNFARAVVSPDGERVARIQVDFETYTNRTIMVYDLATSTSEVIDTNGDPNLVAWSHDGTALYYTTRIYDHNLIDGLNSEQLAQLNAHLPYIMKDIPANQVSLRYIDLATLRDTVAYQGEHSAIGRIFDTPMAVYISLVPNLDMWMWQVLNGEIDTDDLNASLATSEVGVLQIDRTRDNFGSEIFLAFYELFTPFIR